MKPNRVILEVYSDGWDDASHNRKGRKYTCPMCQSSYNLAVEHYAQSKANPKAELHCNMDIVNMVRETSVYLA